MSSEVETSLTIFCQRTVRDSSTSLGMTKTENASEPSLVRSRSGQFLATPDVEFAGSENGDFFYHDGTFRDPKIRDAGFIEGGAQFVHLDWIGSEEQQRFTFRFIRHSANGDASLASFHTESIDNLLLDYFVWHHFTANLGEARKPAFDVEESVLVQPANVTGL